jgi:hypothetical protein
LHTITECRAEDNYTLWLRFNDGLEGHVYLGDLVHTQYFRMLCDIDTFNRVEVDPVENTVTWEGGIKLDPEKLYRDLASKAQSALHEGRLRGPRPRAAGGDSIKAAAGSPAGLVQTAQAPSAADNGAVRFNT